MRIVSSVISSIFEEAEKLLLPQRAIARIERRLEYLNADDLLSEKSLLIGLYQRVGAKEKSADCYDSVLEMIRALRLIPGLYGLRNHAYVLERVAQFELYVLKDDELAEATASSARDIAMKYHLGPLLNLLKHNFPKIFVDKYEGSKFEIRDPSVH